MWNILYKKKYEAILNAGACTTSMEFTYKPIIQKQGYFLSMKESFYFTVVF